jgi:hypothetical protein
MVKPLSQFGPNLNFAVELFLDVRLGRFDNPSGLNLKIQV